MDRIFEEEERRIDLASIRKIDDNISHILDKTDNVAFYKFDGKAWHKQDIHGSIFVFSRSVAPYYGFTILNRRSLSDNVIELLVDGLEFQRCDLYLLYKTSVQSGAGEIGIKSIWFEDEAGCMRISTLLHRLLRLRNESPTKAGAGNILEMFEKSRDRVRQSASPEPGRSPGHSPPQRGAKKRTRGPEGANYRNQHDYRTNLRGGEEKSGAGFRSSRPHIKHQEKSCQGQKKQDKNILSMFSQAHERYNADNTCKTNRVTIMKRSKSELPGAGESIIVPPGRLGLSKSRSSEDMSKLGEGKNEAQTDIKTIPITFQDLVNSVQPKCEGRPLSCYSIEGSSSSSAEEVAISSGEAEQSASPRSSNSDTAPLSKLTANLSMSESAQLLMSPLDFQRGGRSNSVSLPTPAKRMLFTKLGRDDAPTQKLDMDLDQFKRLMIKALQEDDAFLGSLFEIFQKKVTNAR